MAFDIFRVDWILVDSIIIIFLLILLLGVKIFKRLNRWRPSLSNEEISRVNFKGSSINRERKLLLLKSFELTKKNRTKNSNSKSTIIILHTKRNNKFLSALAEGLCSYGLDTIRMTCKFHRKSYQEDFQIETQKEMIMLINTLFEFFKKNEIRLNHNYILINFVPNYLKYEIFLNDLNNIKLIVVNPKLNKFNKTQIIDIKKYNLELRFYLVYSGKINLFLSKISLNNYLKEFIPKNKSEIELFILKEATNSFRKYETILLGLLINIIEKDS